jgi:calcium/calmodulin-dependent protein kinase I
MWAIGVITYFLLCGYTPFDRDTTMEEMQAIINADYSFEPAVYWQGVSQEARDFVNKLLTIDPSSRMTAYQCSKGRRRAERFAARYQACL